MIYYTSDLHLGHTNVIKLCDRPFSSIEEMDETLIANWNAKVHNDDTVYILGDLVWQKCDPIPYLSQLKGKKHLIVGNHDKWAAREDAAACFESIQPYAELSLDCHPVTLCHYPMMTFNHCMRAYMLHGHIHGNTNADYWPYLQSHDRILNASVEVNNYEPVTFDELVANNQKYKAEHSERAM